jgi:hypothetical protein
MPSNVAPGQYPMIGTIFDPSQFSLDITIKIYQNYLLGIFCMQAMPLKPMAFK